MPVNQTVASWVSALSSGAAAAALVGAIVLYGDVRALQQYSERDSEDMVQLMQLVAQHSELMSKMGTLCAENHKRFDRLEPRLKAIEGNRWTFEMEEQAERSLRRDLNRLSAEIEKNVATIKSLQLEVSALMRKNHP